MTPSRVVRALVALLVASAVLAACGGGDDDARSQPSSTQATSVPDPQGVPDTTASGAPTGTGTTGDPDLAGQNTQGLPDGVSFGYLVLVDPSLGLITTDVVEYLTGSDAVAAAAADGANVSSGPYVRDPDPGTEVDVPLGDDVAVTVLGPDGGPQPSDLTALAAAFSESAPPEQVAYTVTPYAITVSGGVVVALDQQPGPVDPDAPTTTSTTTAATPPATA